MYKNENLFLRAQESYELIDSGSGMKLERFGDFTLARPDPQALWNRYENSQWAKADASFVRDTVTGKGGIWRVGPKMPKEWQIKYGGLSLVIKPTSFKHVGLFPEQQVHWEWMQQKIQDSRLKIKDGKLEKIKVLNLFAYTGGASLICAKAGAEVTHVDASRSAIDWAKQNAQVSDLFTNVNKSDTDTRDGERNGGQTHATIRWVLEDAVTFVKRELKRGNTYDAIIMDPPAFGHGPKGEVWKIEESLPRLIADCTQLLSDHALFFLMSGYAAGYSPMTFANNLISLNEKYTGTITCGELAIEETQGTRLLQTGMYAKWER
jgi:23S rRNA (cytosine1962-C5)-methyltransferase